MQAKGCNCRKSKCLKLYCECYANRRICDNECRCLDCQNTSEIVFQNGSLKHGSIKEKWKDHGCSCRRSECIKKYCNCFMYTEICSAKCRCVGCKNKTSLTREPRKRTVLDTPSTKHPIRKVPRTLTRYTFSGQFITKKQKVQSTILLSPISKASTSGVRCFRHRLQGVKTTPPVSPNTLPNMSPVTPVPPRFSLADLDTLDLV